MRGNIFYISRDDASDMLYNVHEHKFLKPEKVPEKINGSFDNYVETYCAGDFERITGIKLKPGSGPVAVRLIKVQDENDKRLR